MIYYVNENKRYDNIFNCIMEASSIVSDIRVFPYENNDEWVNESAKDAIAKFFSGLVEKIRAFFRKIKEFFTKKKTDGKIESAKKEVSSNSIVDIKINVPDPNKLEFEKSISKIQEELRKWLGEFSKQNAELLLGRGNGQYDYNEIKKSFEVPISLSIKDDITVNARDLNKYYDNIKSKINLMQKSMDKLERNIVSEINSFQKSILQNSENIHLNYISAIMSAALNGIQKCTVDYRNIYEKMIDTARHNYNKTKGQNDKSDDDE